MVTGIAGIASPNGSIRKSRYNYLLVAVVFSLWYLQKAWFIPLISTSSTKGGGGGVSTTATSSGANHKDNNNKNNNNGSKQPTESSFEENAATFQQLEVNNGLSEEHKTRSTDTTYTTATSSEDQHQYPRVYIVPLPSEFHRDVLNCSLAFQQQNKNGEKHLADPSAYHANDGDEMRFQQTTAKLPFGPTTSSSTLTSLDESDDDSGLNYLNFEHTPDHPLFASGEYDFDVYFHNMMDGYFNRVDSPDDADLFYLPMYPRRSSCHPTTTTTATTTNGGKEEYFQRLYQVVEDWMKRYPAVAARSSSSNGGDGDHPNFFTAAGDVCSCEEGRPHCTGLANSEYVRKQLRVLAWERYSNLSNERIGNVVVPYPTQLHKLPNWSVTEKRPVLVLGILGYKRKNCVVCGPCGNNWAKWDEEHCPAQCRNIRFELMEQMRVHKDEDDIALWTIDDNPSEEWFPNNEGFWPPTQGTQKMMYASFCLQPAGDTLSRKSFFESLQAGCIPVVFRDDDAYLEQLPFSNIIPYRQIYYYIPESCAVSGMEEDQTTTACYLLDENTSSSNNNNNMTSSSRSFVDVLRNVPTEAIYKRRELIQKYSRMWMYSSHDGTSNGGYNDVDNPDAFLMALRETWRLARDE